MYCSFDFVRAIGRCHSCMDFLWIALFDSISYLLQSRNVHLRISEIFCFFERTSLNFRYIHFLCGTMPMCEYERIREGNIRLADGEYFWNIFLRSDQTTLTTYIASKCSYTAVELNLYMVEGGGGWCVWNSNEKKNRSILIDVPCMIRVHDSFKISTRKFSNLAEMDKSCNINDWIFMIPTSNIHCAYEVSSSYCWNILSLLHLR